MNSYLIYTDASTLTNPGIGGWAALIENTTTQKKKVLISGPHEDTTSNRMELDAVCTVVNKFKEVSKITLRTDSEYVAQNFKERLKGWAHRGFRGPDGKTIVHADLWEGLYEASIKHLLKIEWVKSHAEDTRNVFVDQIAKKAAKGTAITLPDHLPITHL